MSKDVGRKMLPTNFDYVSGAPFCISISMTDATSTSKTDVYDVGASLPPNSTYQILGAGVTGETITNMTLVLGTADDGNGYIEVGSAIAAATYRECDGALVTSQGGGATSSAITGLVGATSVPDLELSAGLTSGTWVSAAVHIWLVPVVLSSDAAVVS